MTTDLNNNLFQSSSFNHHISTSTNASTGTKGEDWNVKTLMITGIYLSKYI